jgi:hypothetical protein
MAGRPPDESERVENGGGENGYALAECFLSPWSSFSFLGDGDVCLFITGTGMTSAPHTSWADYNYYRRAAGTKIVFGA